jgi:hypothetical protein
MQGDIEERLPGFEDGKEVLKAAVIMALLAIVNVFAFITSFGAGVIITLPLTLFIGFMLLRDLLPHGSLPWSNWRK